MLRIRLARKGSKKRPHYRIVVADLARGRGGNIVEVLGTYDPKRGAAAKMDRARALYWVSKGARASDTVRSLLDESRAEALANGRPKQPLLRESAREGRDEGTTGAHSEVAGGSSG